MTKRGERNNKCSMPTLWILHFDYRNRLFTSPFNAGFLARQLQEYILLCCITAIMLNFLYPWGIYRNIFPRNSSIRLKHHHHIVSAFRSYHVLQFHRLNLLRSFVINFGLVAFISDGYKPFDKIIKSIRYSLSHFDTTCLVKETDDRKKIYFSLF